MFPKLSPDARAYVLRVLAHEDYTTSHLWRALEAVLCFSCLHPSHTGDVLCEKCHCHLAGCCLCKRARVFS